MSQTESPRPQNSTDETELEPEPGPSRLPIRTYHCRFCSHLLLATTRHLEELPRRKGNFADENGNNPGTGADKGGAVGGGKDNAIILPLPGKESERAPRNENGLDDDAAGTTTAKITHTTILLSTIIPSPFKTLVRRSDGFEIRFLLRCGRCRVVMGYFLDLRHFPKRTQTSTVDGDGDGTGLDVGKNDHRVAYILPGSLVETDALADGAEGRLSARDNEWRRWNR